MYASMYERTNEKMESIYHLVSQSVSHDVTVGDDTVPCLSNSMAAVLCLFVIIRVKIYVM